MRVNAKERKNKVVEEEVSIVGFIKIIAAILVVLVIFSLITMFATREDKETVNDEIQYNYILVGSILNRAGDDYYVLVAYPNDYKVIGYENFINAYLNVPEHLNFYIVDLSDPFNESYISNEAIYEARPAEMRFNETVLLHVKDGNVVSTRTNDDIASYLEKLGA